MEIKLLTIDNLNAVKELSDELLPEHHIYDFWYNAVASEGIYSYVLIDNKKICGCVVGCFIDGDVEILSFGVHPDYRNKGYGDKLLTRFLKSNRHHKKITLHVRMSNKIAYEMYCNHKFCLRRYVDKYYRTPVETAIVMDLVYPFSFWISFQECLGINKCLV